MPIKIETSPTKTEQKQEHLSTTSSDTDKEKEILEKLQPKPKDNEEKETVEDNKSEVLPINVVIETVMKLFSGLSVVVHPCWEVSEKEASSLVYTLNAAYPNISIEAFAKIMFWINVTMIFVPRTFITIRDFAGKKKSNEVSSNIGQKG